MSNDTTTIRISTRMAERLDRITKQNKARSVGPINRSVLVNHMLICGLLGAERTLIQESGERCVCLRQGGGFPKEKEKPRASWEAQAGCLRCKGTGIVADPHAEGLIEIVD